MFTRVSEMEDFENSFSWISGCKQKIYWPKESDLNFERGINTRERSPKKIRNLKKFSIRDE